MLRQRIHLIVVGTALCLFVGSAFGKPIGVHKHHGRGHVMTQPHRPVVTNRPVIRRPALSIRPNSRVINGRSLFHKIGPKRPHRHFVVIGTPHGRIIKAYPTPRVISRFGVVDPIIVRVWFMNSNGSRTGVELVRRGPGYVGPRGEGYKEMPTKRQLWIAYGF